MPIRYRSSPSIYALDDVAVDHEGRDAVDKALVDHEVARVGQHGGVQPRDIAHEIIEAVAGDAAGGVHVHAVEALHDLSVIGDLIGGNHRLAEALHFHVAAVVGADGNGGINDVRDIQHQAVDPGGVLLLQLLQLRQTLVIRLDGGHVGVDLGLDGGFFLFRGLFQLSEEGAVGLAQRVFPGAKIAGLGDGGAVFGVQLQHLVHHGQLGVLELLFDVFFHQLRIFPDKSNV